MHNDPSRIPICAWYAQCVRHTKRIWHKVKFLLMWLFPSGAGSATGWGGTIGRCTWFLQDGGAGSCTGAWILLGGGGGDGAGTWLFPGGKGEALPRGEICRTEATFGIVIARPQ